MTDAARAPRAYSQPSAIRQLGIITGLADEARIVESVAGQDADLPWPNLGIATAGASATRAKAMAERMLSRGADGLMSFGLAGGLDPALRAGDVVLVEAVLTPDGTLFETDAGWRANLAKLKGAEGLVPGTIVGSDAPVASVPGKRALHEKTAALAVDMESHAVASAAAAAGVSFIALRAIADPATRAVPSAALAGVAASGSTRPLAVFASLMLQPWQLPGVVLLSLDARRGFAGLRRLARLGPVVFGAA